MDTGYPPPNPRYVESPRARYPIALAPSITAWRVAYRELAEDLLSIAKPRQRGCPPVPVRSRWGDPTMPPHHVKVPGPKGPAFMQASQGSSYPWWLVAVAKHNLLCRECVGRWWQPSGDIGILP